MTTKTTMTKRKLPLLLFAIAVASSFCVGGLAVNYYPQIKSRLISQINKWDDTGGGKWPDGFSVVQIQSSADHSLQPAYFVSSQARIKKPLVVSLHTWSADYSQSCPLAVMAKNEDWNYIHPNFRGPNWTNDACLSKKVMSDIDDAIQYAIDNSSVETGSIFVVGASGGGYATLGSYLKTRHNIKAFLAWMPISDLVAWFYQSRSRNAKYAEDILACTSEGMSLNENEAKQRSPMFIDLPLKSNGRLEIFAGIDDGFKGSVPISHSILFFNRLVMHYGNPEKRIGETDFVKLLTHGIEKNGSYGKIGDREVLYSKNTPAVSLTIFDGTHEMLSEYCFNRLKEIAEQGTTGQGFRCDPSPQVSFDDNKN